MVESGAGSVVPVSVSSEDRDERPWAGSLVVVAAGFLSAAGATGGVTVVFWVTSAGRSRGGRWSRMFSSSVPLWIVDEVRDAACADRSAGTGVDTNECARLLPRDRVGRSPGAYDS
jgi:hypothetical protein